jgi:hypothetical protein
MRRTKLPRLKKVGAQSKFGVLFDSEALSNGRALFISGGYGNEESA